MVRTIPILLWFATFVHAQTDAWQQAEQNAKQAVQAIHLAHTNSCAWLSHADRTTGLLPRNLKDSPYWNAKDCAADNYPFITLTGYITDNYYLKQAAQHIFAQEQKYTCRLDALPDDFLFTTQKFRTEQPNIPELIFGAAEYCKDGLNPITEWMGPSPWLPRMEGLIADIWKHAPVDAPAGKLPSDDVEVNGDLLQCMGRLYWLTGRNEYKDWCFRLADHHLFENNLLDAKSIKLRDHGCEVIGGLTEAYAIAVREDPERAARYRPKLHAVLDNILAGGLDENGLMYNSYNPRAGKPVNKQFDDGWGYVYNGFLTVAMIDNEPKYRAAVERALANIHKYKGNPFGSSIDDLADSVEGAINLMNRLPDASAAGWVDESMQKIFAAQQPDGTLEGWYGDGNSSRTALMYALWKTQGVTAAPWVEELQLGAACDQDGTLHVWAKSPYNWSGGLRFDRPRHREFMRMPVDYPRINQFPEWFTVDRLCQYSVQENGGEAKTVTAKDLYMYAVTLKGGKPLKLTVKPIPRTLPARAMAYKSGSAETAVAWQKELRGKLFDLMKLSDLRRAEIPLDAKVVDTTDKGDYTLQEMTLRSTPGREIKVLFALPKGGQGPYPAVVCIHGHGGVRQIVYDETSIYRGFADALARKGFITIATDVGQHEVYESGRTLMGERLWHLMRCVDYLASRPEVDKKRIGCGGLSLGGEMAMWLGAMDERMAATVSAGYLTTMDQMEIGHCPCWKFDGLRELVDWADIYGLIAPRALECQNGFAEPMGGFNVPLARQALREIRPVYKDLNAADKVQLLTHPEGHVINLPGLLEFFERNLK